MTVESFSGVEGEGALDVPSSRISNQLVLSVLDYARTHNRRIAVIEHPKETVTCEQKLQLFQAYPDQYRPYGEIRVARGSLLAWKRPYREDYVLHIGDSEDFIKWSDLKWQLQVRKKHEDLGPYRGDVEAIIGLPAGGVSPFVAADHRLSQILFDYLLQVRSSMNQSARWDFAFSKRHSVLIHPNDLMSALSAQQGVGRIAHWGRFHKV